MRAGGSNGDLGDAGQLARGAIEGQEVGCPMLDVGGDGVWQGRQCLNEDMRPTQGAEVTSTSKPWAGISGF